MNRVVDKLSVPGALFLLNTKHCIHSVLTQTKHKPVFELVVMKREDNAGAEWVRKA